MFSCILQRVAVEMHTSVVIGVYQFIGFHLAKYLLEKGEEVLGVDWRDMGEEDCSEKEMEMGRNSNFLYVPVHKLNQFSLEQPKTIYVSCYDLNISPLEDKEAILSNIIQFIKAYRKNPSIQVIVLLPIEEESEIFQSLLKELEEHDAAKMVFLPTIYGPWQPETMSFEAAIRQKELSEIEKALTTEYKDDTLFVSDIMDAVDKVVLDNEKKIQLQSEDPDQWFQCAKLLWTDEFIEPYILKKISRSVRGVLYKVKNETPPLTGISLQKKHFQRLQLMKKWEEHE